MASEWRGTLGGKQATGGGATPLGDTKRTLGDTQFLPGPEANDLKAIQAWWDTLKGEAPMPSKAQLQPQSLKPFLSRIQLIEVIDGGRDYRARVFGSHWVALAGLDFTNHLYSEFTHDAAREKWTHFCDLVVRSGEPLALTTSLSNVGRSFIVLEALFLPFSDPSGAVGHLLGALQPHTCGP
jgi:hypothetical protein